MREAASKKLETLGLPAYHAVLKARTTANDPETQSHLLAVETELSKLVLWDGQEKISDYAHRLDIKETERVEELGAKKVRVKLVLVPAGEFTMGSPQSETGRKEDEVEHKVRLTRAFLLAITPVTQAQWNAVMGTDPSGFKGAELPVERVSWKEATAFCHALSKSTSQKYRLPTEAEWEFACRAGTATAYNVGDTLDPSQANFQAKEMWKGGAPPEFRAATLPVGSFKTNAWGLFDMHGNVWQWCSDWMAPYPDDDAVNPRGPDSGETHILRGGSWADLGSYCRSATRESGEPDRRTMHIGFRVAMDLNP